MAHELGTRCSHHVGLTACLRPDLRVHTVAQAERQRDPERDDGQQQQIGRGQEKEGSQAYGAETSGVIKRNPTPRTVSM